MAIRKIVCYGDPVLAAPTARVDKFDDGLRELVADMVQTMYAAPGVGLAAPQIGISLNLAVVDVSVGKEEGALLVLANPEIIAMEGELEEDEGCLSVPGFAEIVRRSAEVEIRAQDVDGNEYTHRGGGLLARAFQHEIDHLNGRLYLDRLSGLKKTFFMRRLKKRIKAGEFP